MIRLTLQRLFGRRAAIPTLSERLAPWDRVARAPRVDLTPAATTGTAPSLGERLGSAA